jgi:integrase
MSEFWDYMPARIVKGRRWYIEFYQTDPVERTKKRVREYRDMNRIKDLKERQKVALNHINELNTNLLPFGYPYSETKNLPQHITIIDAVTMSLAIKSRSDRAKTVSSYGSIVNYFIRYIRELGREHTQLRDFSFRDAMMFMDHVLIEKKISARTYNNYRQFITAIWNELIDRGYISQNPWTKVKKQTITEKNRRMLSNDEAQMILNEAWQTDKMISLSILLLYYCFVRPGEQRQMRVSYIDLDAGLIKLPGAITKNRKTDYITIPTQIISLFRKLNIENWHANDYIFGKGIEPHPEIMCGSNSMAERHKAIINRLYENKKLRSKTGISIYSWKDTGAMALIRGGVDTYEIMRQMRHSELSTTQTYLKSLHSVNKSIRDLKGELLLPTS